MADTKITALAAITTVDPAADVLPIVDISDTSMAASGTTKKITSNQILGAGGTATLASATITGDLTVDTSTLKVDSANNRVGIGTASPATDLHIFKSSATDNALIQLQNGTASSYIGTRGTTYGAVDAGDTYIFNSSGNDIVLMADNAAGAIKFAAGGNTESMRLNSTGLGVGGSPTSKLTIGTGSFSTAASGTTGMYTTASGLEMLSDSYFFGSRSGFGLMTLNSSGNVGIGGNASATGIDTGVARLFVVAPNSNTGMAATFIADSVGRGLLVADQGKTNSFGVEVVAGLVKTGGFTSGTSVALFANAVERARVKSTGQVRFVPLAADPSGAEAGDVYYNSSSNKLKCYNGSTWNDLF